MFYIMRVGITASYSKSDSSKLIGKTGGFSMKKFIVLLAFTALVIAGQISTDKVASAMSVAETKQEIVSTQTKLSEESSKNVEAEKRVDSTTESTKKKNKNKN